MIKTNTPLLDAILAATRQPHASFYTPGHKRGQGISQELIKHFGISIFQADLPELPELDNLFTPAGIIQEAQQLAAATFGASETWFLVNGSTSGIIAAILANCCPGDKIILPRNIHKSVISGLIFSGAMPIFISPECDRHWDLANSITPAAVADALAQHPDTKAVMMVYPTYHGVGGNVAEIAKICHQYNIPLLVDEAHGAHFAFHPDFPQTALAAGADLSVQSIHKTLSAMTQASMLHIQGNLIDKQRINQALALIQSSSPSYLLLASLDVARQQMAEAGKKLMAKTLDLADMAINKISNIAGLSVFQHQQITPGFFSFDRTRLTVKVSDLGISGFTADEILCQNHVIAELPTLRHITFIISLGNTLNDINQLVKAFIDLSEQAKLNYQELKSIDFPSLPASVCLPVSLSPRQAFFAQTETLPVKQAINRISAELVCPYPPGIPLLMPGEIITTAVVEYLEEILALGGKITGCSDFSFTTLKVVGN